MSVHHITARVYTYICVCVCVCVTERERERERERETTAVFIRLHHHHHHKIFKTDDSGHLLAFCFWKDDEMSLPFSFFFFFFRPLDGNINNNRSKPYLFFCLLLLLLVFLSPLRTLDINCIKNTKHQLCSSLSNRFRKYKIKK